MRTPATPPAARSTSPRRARKTKAAKPAREKRRTAVEVLPVVAEHATVGVETRETGKVAVHVHPRERVETVEVALAAEEVEVERVPIGRVVARPPATRRRGDVTIVPVVEEVVSIEKHLVLKEEIHIRRRTRVRKEEHEVLLRSEEVEVVHDGGSGPRPAHGGNAQQPQGNGAAVNPRARARTTRKKRQR